MFYIVILILNVNLILFLNYSSPQFSPAFSEPPSPWLSPAEGGDGEATYNHRSTVKMEADESLGNNATISAVLYANMNHPEWKKEFPGFFNYV